MSAIRPGISFASHAHNTNEMTTTANEQFNVRRNARQMNTRQIALCLLVCSLLYTHLIIYWKTETSVGHLKC